MNKEKIVYLILSSLDFIEANIDNIQRIATTSINNEWSTIIYQVTNVTICIAAQKTGYSIEEIKPILQNNDRTIQHYIDARIDFSIENGNLEKQDFLITAVLLV